MNKTTIRLESIGLIGLEVIEDNTLIYIYKYKWDNYRIRTYKTIVT